MRTQRTARRLLILAALAGAVLVAVWIRYRGSPGAPAPPAPAPLASTDAQPPLFASWAALDNLERDEARERLSRYYIDAVLGHEVFRSPPRGLPRQLAQSLLLDDDQLLFSSGRRLWNRELLHQPGLAGQFCYLHSSYCLRKLFDVAFFVDGAPAVVYDNQYRIERFPSHTTVHYFLPEVVIRESKFITWDDRAVAAYAVTSRDGKPHRVTIDLVAPYPPIPEDSSERRLPLIGRGRLQGNPLFLYLDAPGFEPVDEQLVHLRRSLAVAAEPAVARAAVAYRFSAVEAPQPDPPLGDDPVRAHVHEYHRWFADNVPYFNASDPAFVRMWYYRWWIVRFHLVEASTADLQGFAFYEGKLGFDNVIGFAVPAQLKELTYLRDPRYALSQAQNSYRNRAPNGAVVDPPGSPYWGETYSHWIAMALADLHRVHPIPEENLRPLLSAAAADVRAWLTAYDSDRDFLPERAAPRVTGYDLDILSYWFFNDLKLDVRANPSALERVDFASFVYANAAAVAELAEAAGDPALGERLRRDAERIRKAALAHLWDDATGFFYPQRASDDRRIPIRELHGFFPFLTGLAPGEERYLRALQRLVDPQEFWARFPPVITSLAHYREWTWEMDGLTRNIAPHPISMGARTILQVLKNYDQSIVTADHFMELMSRYNDLVYPGVHPGDPLWRPNVHEYYSQWEPHSISTRPKPSDISHDFHSMFCSLIVEGAVGLTPRRDERIELQPLARRWDFFRLDALRYRGHDLSIVWDRPDGQIRYPDRPEGFSLHVDGKLAFTRPTLDHIVYDPDKGELEVLADRDPG